MGESEIRNADVESLVNKAALDGRPMKSNIIRDARGNLVIFEKRKGSTTITEVVKTGNR